MSLKSVHALWFGMTAIAAASAVQSTAVAEGFPRESSPNTVPLFEQARPEDMPPGIDVGSFLFLPSVSETAGYDDNIFASDRHVATDYINATKEQIDLGSQWSRNSIAGRLYYIQQLYTGHASENANTYVADLTGRYDISGEAFLQLDGVISQQPQARASVEASTLSAERPIFNYWTVTLSYTQRLGLLVEYAQLGVDKTAFIMRGDVTRNRLSELLNDRLSLDLTSQLSLFGQIDYAPVEWTIRADERNYNRLTGLIGAGYNVPTVFDGEIGIGVLRQSFKDNDFEELVRPTFDAKITWNVEPITSVILSADRTVTGTETFCDLRNSVCSNGLNTVLGVAAGRNARTGQRNSLESTDAEVRLEHEIRQDLLADVGFRYEHDHFDFDGLNDDTYRLSAGLRYFISRYLAVEADYTYQTRTANLPFDRTYNSGPFTENGIEVTFNVGL